MAHTASKGSSKLGRDSQAKRLGVKLFGGQKIKAGQIILRQRGLKWRPGEGVEKGGDDTLFAVRDGAVKFYQKKIRNFDGARRSKTFVSVK
ncbi:MAG: 50S ribosomal protein L27 [Candidatus Berkelbacteria bacterium Licking1014_2]|uniref:Large ribosomal subunit protein bL27 n=1 Tax=Candidatus Berkelbacteria bacterium Licking1014_2 TaxID=2017146 RepID=A0A554LU90_9BACT|nr:MAG: 50S ribosomal protein L27 [Candidatus Berkelbacteria bacterium Licking1014_2]